MSPTRYRSARRAIPLRRLRAATRGGTFLRAAVLLLRRVARAARAWSAESRAPPLRGPIPGEVIVYEISGPLRLGAAQRAMAALNHVGDPARAVVLLCHDVHTLDATALVALESALDEVARHPAVAVLAGMRPQPLALLREAAVLGRRGVFVCNDTERAMDVAARAARGELTPEEPGVRPANPA
jgi:SulP family sulfate permease